MSGWLIYCSFCIRTRFLISFGFKTISSCGASGATCIPPSHKRVCQSSQETGTCFSGKPPRFTWFWTCHAKSCKHMVLVLVVDHLVFNPNSAYFILLFAGHLSSSLPKCRTSLAQVTLRSERQGAPVLIWPVQRPTAKSAMVVSCRAQVTFYDFQDGEKLCRESHCDFLLQTSKAIDTLWKSLMCSLLFDPDWWHDNIA